MSEHHSSKKRLQSTRGLLWEVINGYYGEGLEAKRQGRPVVWLPPMNGVIESLYTMGLFPAFPENWSPVCAATGLTPRNFEVSEGMGYSRDLCGYLRNIVGYFSGTIEEEGLPLGGLPKPDLLIAFGGGCAPAMKIFQLAAERFKVPTFVADLPQVGLPDIDDSHVLYALEEMDRLHNWLQEQTGARLDLEALRRTAELSDEACALWDEIMGMRAIVPAPFSAAEIGIMFVMVTRQGTQEAVNFLKAVRDEVAAKVEAREGVLPEERFRLFWDNIPLWYNMGLLNYPERYGGVVVAETYSAAWSWRMDPSDPLRSLAMKSLVSYPLVSCVSLQTREEMVLKACRDYKIDGAIFHVNRSCKPISMGQAAIARRLQEELGIPSVFFEACHMDSRSFSMAQFETRIGAFMELLGQSK
jgi:benzoyl-CoA reductase/2-hydroxyglutaryl-CoA dehydratase subunit BcrC/BadD/HgdB